mmetsp:Transcript_43602/g.120602  ORF Transcript_43602/g.120602 Transcript_43602/m.120602 type:complete len:294 (+) Transcript_43602:843-1724(+)
MTKSWNSSRSIVDASLPGVVPAAYARKIDLRCAKLGLRMSCASFSHVGNMKSCPSCMSCHVESQSSSVDSPSAAAAASKRSAKTYVCLVITCSSFRSPSTLATKPATAAAASMCWETARNLSTPQRAMHSSISSKSSVTSMLVLPDSFCALTKAALACGSERRHLNSVPIRSSPTTSEPRMHVKVPSTLRLLSMVTHCGCVTLPVSSRGILLNHPSSRVRSCSMTALTAECVITSARKSAASSRCARGMMASCSVLSSEAGTGRMLSWCSMVSSPNSGLSRPKEMRTIALRNS